MNELNNKYVIVIRKLGKRCVMDRDKLIEALRLAIARVLDFKTDKRELELLADHLIADGMGNITTKALEEAYAEIKELQDFKTRIFTILGTTKKPMLEAIRELKHRADIAEEALKIASGQISCPHRINLIPRGNSCGNCVGCPYIIEDNNKYCKAGYGDGTEECDTSKAYLCWAEYFKQKAEQRLKERV